MTDDARVSLVDVAEAMPGSAAAHVERIFPAWAMQHGLTTVERRMVLLAVNGSRARSELADALGLKESTVKKQINAICKKVNAATFRDVVVSVLRAALVKATVAPGSSPE